MCVASSAPTRRVSVSSSTFRLPTVVAPYARRTRRLTDLLTLIGFALGGEAGKRLVAGMGLATSPDMLLRLIHAAEDASHPTPRVLGVDDFSFRRRISFGTILIDLEKRMPVDLLPDREAETFAKWLLAHPGVEIISRDRGGDYARGGKQGAPNAQQIADRWHVLKNLSETMQSFFLRKQPQLKAATQIPEASTSTEEALSDLPWHTGQSKHQEEKSQRYHQERVERYHTIHDLAAKQVDVATIARQVGLSRHGVYNYLQMKQPPERTRIHRPGGSRLDPYKAYLIRRWNEGCRNAQLMRDNSVPVNPVKSDEQRKTSQEGRARRCCLPCGPAKSTTASRPRRARPHALHPTCAALTSRGV